MMNIVLSFGSAARLAQDPPSSGGKWTLPSPYFFASVGLILLVVLIIWLRNRRIGRSFNRGIFPIHLKYNTDNLQCAYVCLAGLMFLKEQRNYRDKLKFLNAYCHRYFSGDTGSAGETLEWLCKNPVQVTTIAAWLTKHLHEDEQRTKVLNFLVDFSSVSGRLSETELLFIEEIAKLLNLR